MAVRTTPRSLRTKSPHEVATSQRQADVERIDPLLMTPADELDQLETEPMAWVAPLPGGSLPRQRRALDDLDHIGLDVELPGDQPHT